MGSTDQEDGETVSVSRKGQATIPKRFRERYDIDAPGRVRFEENADGELVVRPVKSATAFRGAGSASKTAGELLAEGREADREEHLLSSEDE